MTCDEDDQKKRDHALMPDWLTDEDPLPFLGGGYESYARRIIAGNAIRRYREDGENGRVSYSRRKVWYSDNNRKFYWPRSFSYRHLLPAMAQMEEAGLIFHDKKSPGNRHWQSWFLATEKLMDWASGAKIKYAPTRRVILRDEDKNEVAYNDKTRAIIKMNCDIDEINAYIAKQTITVNGKVLKEGDPIIVANKCVTGAARILLRRIYNESWYKGGRWYNDVQNVPRPSRPWILLNGHPVDVYDYSAFFPGLLYALVGASRLGDPYTIPVWPRPMVKLTLNILLNAKDATSAIRAAAGEFKKKLGDRDSQAKRYDKARQIIAALKKRHEPIAQFFHADIAKVLMWHESKLMEFNIRDLMELEIPFVPLHDALLVPQAALPTVKSIMDRNLATYREILTEAGQKLQNAPVNLDNDSVAVSIG
jgi:hypothetical protein